MIYESWSRGSHRNDLLGGTRPSSSAESVSATVLSCFRVTIGFGQTLIDAIGVGFQRIVPTGLTKDTDVTRPPTSMEEGRNEQP